MKKLSIYIFLLAAVTAPFAIGQSFNWPGSGGGSGDASGPASSTDNAVARFNGAGGKTLQNSGVVVDDSDNVTGVAALTIGGDLTGVAALTLSGNLTTGAAASRALTTNGSSVVTASATTSTELGYVNGVTSAIQTQLNAKEPTVALTASRALASTAGGVLGVATTTAAELDYVSGVTSAIQTQLNGKEADINLTISRGVVSDGSGNLAAATTTATEIGYVNGVTSAIQTQINGKEPTDADLTALAGVASAGMLSRTGAGTASARTIAAGSSKVSVTNGDGVSGNPTIDVTEVGVTDASDASAGDIGEYIETPFLTGVSLGGSAGYYEMANITLTAGDWDLTVNATYIRNGATVAEGSLIAVCVDVAADLCTGATVYRSRVVADIQSTSVDWIQLVIPNMRISISAGDTYYVNAYALYSVGTPKYAGVVSARRVR